jgi:hypothetical protein
VTTPTVPTQVLLDVVTRLWFEVDHLAGARASSFFTPDATLTFDQRTFTGTAEIDAVYAARAARGSRVSRHLVTNLVVVRSDAAFASTVSTMLLFAQDGEAPHLTTAPAAVGDVLDELVLRDGRWLIAARTIRMLFLASDDALAVPTRPDPAAGHQPDPEPTKATT